MKFILQFIFVVGVIDGGSDTSYIHNNILKRLNITSTSKITLAMSTFGSSDPTPTASSKIEIDVVCLGGRSIRCSFYSTDCIVGNSSLSPPAKEVSEILPAGFEYADSDLFRESRRPIEILIGNDLKNLFVRINQDKIIAEGLIIRPTVFRWIPSSRLVRLPFRRTNTLMVSKSPNVDSSESKENFLNSKLITSLWDLEVLGIKTSKLCNSEFEVIEFFRKTTRFDKIAQCYVVSWLRRTENLKLPTQFRMCVARLRTLLENTSPEILSKYNEIFQQYLELGIIERAPDNAGYMCHYLPHRRVVKNEDVRSVFDG